MIEYLRKVDSRMNFRICICCGEPMAQHGNALSRNPNICASCSSILDGELEARPEAAEEGVRPLPQEQPDENRVWISGAVGRGELNAPRGRIQKL